MNDIQSSQASHLAGVNAARPESSAQGSSSVRDQQASAQASNAAETVVDSAIDVNSAVAQMNDFIQMEQRDLQFSVDEELGRTIVRVTDRETGDLIRQIPEETFIELARSAREQEQIQLINVQG